MSTQRYHEPKDVSLDNHRHTEREAPPYRRWPYETQRDERRVSPEPESEPLPWQRDWSHRDDGPELRPREQRQFEAWSDQFDHHHGRSTAATWFDPSEAPDGDERRFEILKSWNDGARDSDRQSVECKRDKSIWIDSWSQRLELPAIVAREAKWLIRDLGDLSKLGAYNGVHRSVLACLTRAYWRFSIRRGHNFGECWYGRDDVQRLISGIGLTDSELREAAKLVGRKTNVPS